MNGLQLISLLTASGSLGGGIAAGNGGLGTAAGLLAQGQGQGQGNGQAMGQQARFGALLGQTIAGQTFAQGATAQTASKLAQIAPGNAPGNTLAPQATPTVVAEQADAAVLQPEAVLTAATGTAPDNMEAALAPQDTGAALTPASGDAVSGAKGGQHTIASAGADENVIAAKAANGKPDTRAGKSAVSNNGPDHASQTALAMVMAAGKAAAHNPVFGPEANGPGTTTQGASQNNVQAAQAAQAANAQQGQQATQDARAATQDKATQNQQQNMADGDGEFAEGDDGADDGSGNGDPRGGKRTGLIVAANNGQSGGIKTSVGLNFAAAASQIAQGGVSAQAPGINGAAHQVTQQISQAQPDMASAPRPAAPLPLEMAAVDFFTGEPATSTTSNHGMTSSASPQALAAALQGPGSIQLGGGMRAGTATLAHAPGFVASQVGMQITRAVNAGENEFSLKLNPPELGRVEARLEFTADRGVRATIFAENRETLNLLQRDAHVLEKALNDAGVRADAGSLSFSLKQQGGDGAESSNDRRATAGSGEDGGRDGLPAIDVTGQVVRHIISDSAVDITI